MFLMKTNIIKGTPRYGEREMALMKKEITAFIKRQYGDSPDDFKEPVYVFAIGIGGQSACVFPAVKYMRRQPNRTLIECDSLGIDYFGYEKRTCSGYKGRKPENQGTLGGRKQIRKDR